MLNQTSLKKIFSEERMQRYFDAHEGDCRKAALHYQCNMELAESFYPSIAVFEVALRNAINRELTVSTGRNDWYDSPLFGEPAMRKLHNYINQAKKHIDDRKELLSSDRVVAELTLGFWVTLFNSEYERKLWQALRRAFRHMPHSKKQRQNVSAPLNLLRNFRNRIFHHEPICWNIDEVRIIHEKMTTVIGWVDSDIPMWIASFDRFESVAESIEKRMGWK
ncbi:MAG: Abi family protein [Alistipes sp.]|jgi:hypothetical protein|nr:Abi family protein [Alistipes sp.]